MATKRDEIKATFLDTVDEMPADWGLPLGRASLAASGMVNVFEFNSIVQELVKVGLIEIRHNAAFRVRS
jgi:hypothetical protein